MGPRLGPLVATGVCLEVSRYRPGHFHAIGKALGVDDSKATAAFGRMAFAEGLALALAERELGHVPDDADALLGWLSLDPAHVLRRRCPTTAHGQCWSCLALPCFGGDVSLGREVVARLARRGVHVRRVRTTLACVAELNEQLRLGHARTDVDLAQFERLVLDARRSLGAPVRAVCGMVGGIRKYRERFQHFDPESVSTVAELRRRCCYDVADVGRVAFEVDADEHHLPVALASMVGKYVRELAVERQNNFYATHDSALPRASGYHDPVTTRFIEQTATLRRRLGLVDDCFLRDSAAAR